MSRCRGRAKKKSATEGPFPIGPRSRNYRRPHFTRIAIYILASRVPRTWYVCRLDLFPRPIRQRYIRTELVGAISETLCGTYTFDMARGMALLLGPIQRPERALMSRLDPFNLMENPS